MNNKTPNTSRLNWVQRHLNWVWILSYLIYLATIAILASAISNATVVTYVYLAMIVVYLLFTAWIVVDQKGRSVWWVFIPFSPLFLSNKKNKKEKQ